MGLYLCHACNCAASDTCVWQPINVRASTHGCSAHSTCLNECVDIRVRAARRGMTVMTFGTQSTVGVHTLTNTQDWTTYWLTSHTPLPNLDIAIIVLMWIPRPRCARSRIEVVLGRICSSPTRPFVALPLQSRDTPLCALCSVAHQGLSPFCSRSGCGNIPTSMDHLNPSDACVSNDRQCQLLSHQWWYDSDLEASTRRSFGGKYASIVASCIVVVSHGGAGGWGSRVWVDSLCTASHCKIMRLWIRCLIVRPHC